MKGNNRNIEILAKSFSEMKRRKLGNVISYWLACLAKREMYQLVKVMKAQWRRNGWRKSMQ
jgi:hypothetical protein